LDALAVQKLSVNSLILMENAGRGAADAIQRRLHQVPSPHAPSADAPLAGVSAAVLAGPGNNGGDGFVVARHLVLRGARVDVLLLAPRDRIRGDADANLRIVERMGLHVAPYERHVPLADYRVVIDAIVGTGAQGPLRGPAAEAVRAVNACNSLVVALDVPSGLDCDTGEPTDPTVRASLTVTFAAPKAGFASEAAREFVGEVIVADIGVPAGI
jgi:NAD(P)H-hydrate epimerase